MRKLVFTLALFFLVACASVAQANKPKWIPAKPEEILALKPTDPFWQQVEIISQMAEAYDRVKIGVNTDIIRAECGEENGYYYGWDIYEAWGLDKPTIVLCKEMDKYPSTALLYAAHEMGHAITDWYTDTLSESDADELGALAMLQLGHETDLFVASVSYLREKYLGHVPGDTHPPNGYRYWFFHCMEEGYDGLKNGNPKASEDCKALYTAMDDKWTMRLAAPIEYLEQDNGWQILDVDDLMLHLLESQEPNGPQSAHSAR